MIDRFFGKLAVVTSLLFLVTMGIGCYEIVADKLFGAPTSWSFDVVVILNAICFMIGGACALQSGRHITISLLRERMRGRLEAVVDRLNMVIVLVYLLPVGWFAFKGAEKSIARGETSGHAWNGPMPQLVRAALFLGFALLAIRLVLLVLERRRLFNEEAPMSEEV